MASCEVKPLCIRITRIAAITHDQIAVSAIHYHCVEPENATITSGANCPFLHSTTAFFKESINDLQLRGKALRVDRQIREPVVVVHGELSADTSSLCRR